MTKKQFVAVLPDGTKHQFEHDTNSRIGIGPDNWEIGKIVAKAGYRAERKNPQTITVKIYSLDVVNLEIKETYYKTLSVMPPMTAMTNEEFAEEENEILKDIPEEFHSALSYQAYEDGHSAGHEEVLLYLRRYVNMIKEPLEKFIANRGIKQ